jgi:hypothetical protein
MRALLIDDETRAKVQRVLDYALDPKHWYRPSKDSRIPGDDERFIARLNTFRCVFTVTENQGMIFRHLSISVPSQDYPNPIAAFTIAEMFGFTGWDGKSVRPPRGWMIHVDEVDHCIQLGQPYGGAQATA